MVFLKSILILLWNMLPGFLIVFSIKQLLFFPREEKHFSNGKKIPLTPGFAYKFKNWIMHKIKRLLQDYINDSKNFSEKSRISIWEETFFQNVWDKFEFFENIKYIPHSWKENIRYFFSMVFYEIAKQFLRKFVPYLMDYFEVDKYVELLDKKIDIDLVKKFYCAYIYKYVMLFVLAWGFFNGFWNLIIYLIIK
ncbi:MAG: hypothetical protein Q7J16_05855 [Candidatus Cloacimonadales bacterium]|nr:hypothetical protein [Candidatus Cloacimonadales bacterium]